MSNHVLPNLANLGRGLLDPARVPKHVAIIMDGNRRWALQRGGAVESGHWKGADTLIAVTEAAIDLGIKTLTVYTFSTENWQRPESEVLSLMKLFEIYLRRMTPNMVKNGVKLATIGNLTPFPSEVQKQLQYAKEATQQGSKIDLVLALNYGGRDDLRRAVVKIARRVAKGQIGAEDLTEDDISRALDTANWPDPELLIRTSGEKRVSNFLLWQISYAEVYMTEVLWPDFSKEELIKAIIDYQDRQRRYGG